ncbi:MAG: hypothetical protein ACK56I_08980 [bacterium]
MIFTSTANDSSSGICMSSRPTMKAEPWQYPTSLCHAVPPVTYNQGASGAGS